LLAKSELDMARIRSGLINHGLPAEFAETPPNVMKLLLEHIDDKYESVENYLQNYVGVGIEQQCKVIECISHSRANL
jgi:hypothetical protein